MQEHIDDTPAPAPVGESGGEGTNDATEEAIDKVCDPCGLVPSNLEAAFAHKKQVKMEKEKDEEVKAESEALLRNQFEPDVEAPKEEGSVLSNFNIDCCGKAPSTDIQDKQFPAEKLPIEENPDEPMMKNGESGSVMTGNNSQQTRSLAEIAAKMDEIDMETAADETVVDKTSDENSLQKLAAAAEWYKQPLYASLIVLTGLLGIAILVMAILIIKN